RRHTRCYRDWSSDVCSSDLFPRVPGVGRKTAERLIVEMRDRLAPPQETSGAALAASASAAGEAYGALVALGYRPAEAARLLKARSEERRVGRDCRSHCTPLH